MNEQLQGMLEACRELERKLEDFEPGSDSQAWLLRECCNDVARVKGILEAMVNDLDA